MRLLITRPRNEALRFARLVEAAGFEPVLLPAIDIRPAEDERALREALRQWEKYDWVVFTSANAVRFLPPPPPTKNTSPSPKIAAIGTKTAAALQARGITPDLVPSTYTAEALARALGDVNGQWILFPSADIARDTLPENLERAGGIIHQITVYRTLPAAPDPQGLSALREGVDWLTFTSPSTARNFITLTRGAGLNPFQLAGSPRVACIGPVTAEAARELGFRVDAIAQPHTAEGLLAAIQAQTND